MTHGGGTVAGESPDKAEQRKSAAGDDGKDPRLSVLQDRVDEPTAVFKALAPRTAPEDAGVPEGAAARETEGAAAPGTAGGAAEGAVEDAQGAPEGGASGGDAREAAEDAEAPAGGAPEGDRLRAAVAAWVATEDEDEDGPEAAGTAGEAPADAGADADAGAAEAGPAGAGAAEPAAGGATAAAAAVDAAEAGAAESARAGAATDADADEVHAAAAGAAVSGAATVAAADNDAADAAPAGAAEPARAGATAAAANAAAADATETSATEPAGVAAATPEPEADATPKAEPEASGAAPARTTSWAKAADAAEAPKAAAAGDESWFAARKPTPKAEPEDAPAPAAKPAPAPVPVDQPTAVFKAPKLPAEPKAPKPPVVDQPTTALKLPESMFRPLQGDITQEQPSPSPTPPPAAKAPVTPSLSEPERTRQQPLPPRPPLEILAELTNTPPPPETPLRTGVRRVKIWTPIVILLLVVFAVVQFVRPLPEPALTLSAEPTFTFDGGELSMPWPSEGQGAAEVEGVGSLGTYGPQKPAPIASVAKTMTAYVILRDHPIKGKEKGPEIEVDKTAGEQAKAKDESTAPIKEGQSYTEKELLELLMIPSGNNVARLLARWDAGSEAAFVEKMNAAAKELGMTESTYTDPSGLQSSTVSTPLDQLKLAKAVMQYDVFREIVDMPNVTVDGIPGRIENNNKILLEPGVSGIKTGSSTPAGGNLLWAANTVVDGKKQRILGIVMGAKDADQLYQKLDLAIANSLKVIQQAQKDVTSAAVVKKGQVVGYVDDGLGGRTPVVATKELRAIGWPGLKVRLELTNGGKAVPHSGKSGDVVGQVSIGTGNGKVSAPVALQGDLVEPGFDKKLTRVG
ncbi:D-alanyl-D-alanine carboxypeptidase [Streptomyces sp. NPDC094032]|uniref:D-alanyl-D-alanine carboxypeptidase family protein n=1 Tax=Streptomyces sp. NPDC094032 TaxID=3155308 RepID=UPI00332245C3